MLERVSLHDLEKKRKLEGRIKTFKGFLETAEEYKSIEDYKYAMKEYISKMEKELEGIK